MFWREPATRSNNTPNYILFESHPERGAFLNRKEVRILHQNGYELFGIFRGVFCKPVLRKVLGSLLRRISLLSIALLLNSSGEHMQLSTSCSSESIIVAHKEDTSSLEMSLRQEGFAVQVIRKEYSQRELGFSAIIRCLITHSCAWKVAAQRDTPTVIMEADFVPSRGFGSMPVPVPESRIHNSVGYLYACGPQIWDIEDHRYARGHAGAMVALSYTSNGCESFVGVLRRTDGKQSCGGICSLGCQGWLLAKGTRNAELHTISSIRGA